MTDYYNAHKKYDGNNQENCYDGIIDKKNNNQYICIWHRIIRLLNQYNDRLELLNIELGKLNEIIMLQTEKITNKYKYEEI